MIHIPLRPLAKSSPTEFKFVGNREWYCSIPRIIYRCYVPDLKMPKIQFSEINYNTMWRPARHCA